LHVGDTQGIGIRFQPLVKADQISQPHIWCANLTCSPEPEEGSIRGLPV
jgi:hypothetical protein